MSKYEGLPQPSPEQERANAAYVWAVTCMEDLRKVLSNRTSPVGTSWAEIEWTFNRLKNAVEAEREACEVMGRRENTSPPPPPSVK